MENKNVGIYKITNLVNGKFYIGSSSNLKKRFYEHRRELNLGIHINKHLQSACHNQEENADVIESNKNYIKNKTCGENKFSIYDLNGKLLFECKYKKDVIFYLTGSTKRNGNTERKLKLCVENGESVCLYNKYIVKFVNALNNGDIIEVPRQLNRDVVKGIKNDANGKA